MVVGEPVETLMLITSQQWTLIWLRVNPVKPCILVNGWTT